MNKGSTWRKWDLHVHTPFSVLNNGFGSDWDKYVKYLFDKAISEKISAIGITDYFTIDGYKKIKVEYLNNPSKLKELFSEDQIEIIKNILIVPNVEFRLKKLVGQNRINFHILFSNEVSIEDIEENFLHELDFVYESGPQTDDEKRKLKIKNLNDLGKKLKAQHQEFDRKSDLEIGMMNAVVDDEQITQILNNRLTIFKDKYFIVLPCDEDLSKVSWNGQDHHARKLLIQKSDILIGTNANTIKWALGGFNLSKDDYIKEFKSLKPCIAGSDSHTLEELFTKNSEKTTWIKANPTFEGLRQITFEPSQRIFLSKEEPYTKDPKNIIEEIKIISADKTFTNTSLFLNDNLNVIIGGKSSGKSILLYNIAKILFQDNNKHSLLKTYNPDTKKEEFKYDFGDDFDFIVRLKSGSTQSIKRDQAEASILPTVKYIPQNYLSELAERKFKKSNELNKLVRELILEDKESDDEYSYFLTKVKQNDKQRENLINNYFDLLTNITELNNQLINLGNKAALNQNISNGNKEITKLKQEAGFSIEDNASFDLLKENDRHLKIQEANIIEDWSKTRNFNSELILNINELISKKNLFLNSLNDQQIRDHYRSKYAVLDQITATLLEVEADVLTNDSNHFVNEGVFSNKLNGIWNLLNQNKERFAPYNLKIDIKNKIEVIQASQAEEEKKLNAIINLEKEISLKKNALQLEFDKIFLLYNSSFEEYSLMISKLESRINSLEDENLQIKGVVRFNFNKFKEIFIGISNSTSKSYDIYKIFGYDNTTTFNFEDIIEDKKNIFLKIASKQYVLRKQTTPQQAIKDLLQDHYFDYWEVSSNNDTLYKMSTGKASFIILKLIIGLSKSKAPILIDQPEDNLDNRSITTELVEYLKIKKLERQIILVTHNPNIVVNSDAENVIIAHQYGQQANEQILNFKFDYINGALENSFDKISENANILKSMGVREHVAEILEGGKDAFKQRELKYRFR